MNVTCMCFTLNNDNTYVNSTVCRVYSQTNMVFVYLIKVRYKSNPDRNSFI